MRPYLYFDLETTGVDKIADKIVEIAIVRFDGEKRFEFQSYINPEIPIPKAASDIHGITDEIIKDAPTFKQLAKKIHNIFSGCDLYGYNIIAFDIPFIVNQLNLCGFELELDKVLFIDACVIFKRQYERTLTAAVKHYTGEDHTGAHGALADVEATIAVLTAQKEKHFTDIGILMNDDLAKYCNYDKLRADISGNFAIDEDGEYILNFGKHKGQKAKNQLDYLKWMSGQTFLSDTKKIINQIIKS
jgi:DNA polymerase-3 subunit epsilon